MQGLCFLQRFVEDAARFQAFGQIFHVPEQLQTNVSTRPGCSVGWTIVNDLL